MCDEAVRIESCSLGFVSDHFKAQGMSREALRMDSYTLRYVPDHFRTQGMCIEAAEARP